MRLSARFLRHLAAPALVAAAALAAGCATTAQPPASVPATPTPGASAAMAEPATSTDVSGSAVPVVRYSRYTLVELVPEPAQRDLMRQVIEVTIPPSFDASVGDALRHVLLRTGYRLCDAADAAPLYALALPAAHLRLGPLPLRDALLALAGPAWELSIDDGMRLGCFQRRASSTAVPVPAARSPEPAQLPRAQEVQP